jgi:hypothetical protein
MAGHRIASLLKASPEGEGFHPSQTGTLRKKIRVFSSRFAARNADVVLPMASSMADTIAA